MCSPLASAPSAFSIYICIHMFMVFAVFVMFIFIIGGPPCPPRVENFKPLFMGCISLQLKHVETTEQSALILSALPTWGLSCVQYLMVEKAEEWSTQWLRMVVHYI